MKGLGACFSSAIKSRQLDVGIRSGVLPPFCALAQSSTVEPVMAST